MLYEEIKTSDFKDKTIELNCMLKIVVNNFGEGFHLVIELSEEYYGDTKYSTILVKPLYNVTGKGKMLTDITDHIANCYLLANCERRASANWEQNIIPWLGMNVSI